MTYRANSAWTSWPRPAACACATSAPMTSSPESFRAFGSLSGKLSTSVPWAKARIFQTRIRRNIKLAECPSFGRSIFAYAPTCNGAQDYMALAQELLGETPVVMAARVEIDDRGQASVVSAEKPSRAEAKVKD